MKARLPLVLALLALSAVLWVLEASTSTSLRWTRVPQSFAARRLAESKALRVASDSRAHLASIARTSIAWAHALDAQPLALGTSPLLHLIRAL